MVRRPAAGRAGGGGRLSSLAAPGRLPAFTLAEYGALLDALAAAGYRFEPVSRMPRPGPGRTAYMRHDIDVHLARVDELAELEAGRGVRATYYVLPNGPYNPFFAPNQRVLRRLVELGHEVGLHYDLSTYPGEPARREARFRDEAARIAEAAGAPVRTACTHLPCQGLPDPFREGGALVHPHDPAHQDGVTYVSDSCRAWRDETLLACLGPGAPQRLLLTTHPELWLGGPCTGRRAYLRGALWENGSRPYRAYLDEVERIWDEHPAPRLHDARERGATPPPPPHTPRMHPMPTVREVVRFLDAEARAIVRAPGAWDASVHAPAPLSTAGEGTVSFCGATARDPAALLRAARATVVVVDAPLLEGGGAGAVPVLVPSANARLDFVRLLQNFFAPPRPSGVHPSAVVDPSAQVDPTAYVGPLCTVGPGVRVGAGTVLHAGVHLYAGVRVGSGVTIHSGAVIGADGYGYERDEHGVLVRFPHLGGVVIEDGVEIGANTCVDRGALGDTRVCARARVDNLVHVGHNVQVGEDAAVTAMTVLGGSTQVGARSWLAPGTVLRDRIVVGDETVVGLGAIVTRDVPAGATVFGNPAREIAEARAVLAALRRLAAGAPAEEP